MKNTPKIIQWNWYGTWVFDWLYEENPWECFDIWQKAYILENPELDKLTTLELVANHYTQSLFPVENSLLMKVWKALHWLPNLCGEIRWQIHFALTYLTSKDL
jgi:hypothetical protein